MCNLGDSYGLVVCTLHKVHFGGGRILVSPEADKEICSYTMSQNINVRVDRGTCNVCSAPCSSCLHVKKSRMEPKIDESLVESSRESGFSYSVDDIIQNEKSRRCRISQHTTSETSNVISVNSNFDSSNKKAEIKDGLKISDISDGSQDAEVSKLLSRDSVREKSYTADQHKEDAQNGNSICKFEDVRGLEGHDDNSSCISGTTEGSKMPNINKGTIDTKVLTCAASPSSLASQDAILLHKHDPVGMQNKSSGEVASRTVCGPKSASYASGDIRDNKTAHVEGNSEPLTVECIEVKAESDSDDLRTKAKSSAEQKKEVEKTSELLPSTDVKRTSTHSESLNESDESDIVEHDVKVCDICGDAGREDLLAVCCSCSEGAEHTYCMQEMLDKIPEGDWLCQDCKFEKIKAQEKVRCNSVDGDGPDDIYQVPKHVDSKNADTRRKLNRLVKGVDIKAETDSSHVKLSGKRKADDAEVSSAAKRQVLEPEMRSPKNSSLRRVDMLSRDSSFKNLDKGKVKPAHPISTGVQPSNRAPEVACPSLDARPHTSRGNFLKSKSFSSASSKQKVKLVDDDDDVFRKQKSNREVASIDTKGRLSKMMGKSTSFRSVNSDHSKSTDSRLKMPSPKFSHAQDTKAQRNTTDRRLIERKNSLRLERPLVDSAVASSTTSSPRINRNLTLRDSTVPFSSTSNNREIKSVHSDNKVTQLLRPVNKVVHKGSEASVLSGEGKRLLSASRTGSFVEKSMLARTKDDCSPTFGSTEGPVSKISESTPVGLTQAQESTNLVENVKNLSDGHPKQSSTAGVCQKCKDVGHSAEFCTIDSTEQSLAPDIHTSKSSNEAIHKGNKLKAAIEAAMLKKPGICKRNRSQVQSEEVPVSEINRKICSQDQLSNTFPPKKLVSGEEGSKKPTSTELQKQTTGTNVKQFRNSAEEVIASTYKLVPSAEGKSIVMNSSNSDLLNMSAIPKHEYIWQGSFEVCRSGKLPDCYDGFQAHLSAGASPRVLETMNKFPSIVILNEVPRHSAWPIQFVETGVNEDHIALYFFARDYESYEKSYKSMLENMMRNDLALRGNVDDVEILIFPSNLLPIKYQRWNMMFFLWGVFKGKRSSCLLRLPGSPMEVASSREMPTAIVSSTVNICSLEPVDKDLPTCNQAHDVVADVQSPIDLQYLPSSKTMDGNRDSKAVSDFQQSDGVNCTKEQQGHTFDCNSVPTDQMKPPRSWQDTRSRISLEEREEDSKVIKEPRTSVQVLSSTSVSSTNDEKKTCCLSTPCDIHPSPLSHGKYSAGMQDLISIQSIKEVDNEDQLRPVNPKIEGLLEAEAVAEKETRFSSPRELKSLPISYSKQSVINSLVLKSETTFAGSSQAVHGTGGSSIFDGGGVVYKKPKLDYSDLYDLNDQTSSSKDGSEIQDSSFSFPVKKEYTDGPNESSISRTSGNVERYIFPVDLNEDSSCLENTAFSENEEPLQAKIPNLELALGDEMKPPLKHSLPHFLVAEIEKNNQVQHPGRTSTTPEEDASAALSLSLAFPFADKEQAGQPVATEELLPPRRPQQEVNFLKSFLEK